MDKEKLAALIKAARKVVRDVADQDVLFEPCLCGGTQAEIAAEDRKLWKARTALDNLALAVAELEA